MDVGIGAYYMISIKALSIISLSQRHWILIHQFLETKWGRERERERERRRRRRRRILFDTPQLGPTC